MSLAFRTGTKRTHPCPLCGVAVEQEESRVYTRQGDVSSWFSAAHTAPCGAPCFGGGARGSEEIKLYRNGGMHGSTYVACKTCEASKAQPHAD